MEQTAVCRAFCYR